MNIQLIAGEFSSKDALELVTQMIQVKVKYHENKIAQNMSEEDIKYRESKIKSLQNELYQIREKFNSNNQNLSLDGIIRIEQHDVLKA